MASKENAKARNRETPSISLASLIDSGVIAIGQKVCYAKNDGSFVVKEGRVTREGIQCLCCQTVYNLTNFEAHAGCHYHRPSANIFLDDGRSLIQCQMQATRAKGVEGSERFPNMNMERGFRFPEIQDSNQDGRSPVPLQVMEPRGFQGFGPFGRSPLPMQMKETKEEQNALMKSIQLQNPWKIPQFPAPESKANISASGSEGVCTLCRSDGNGLLLCTGGCLSMFHLGCLGLKDFPEGSWFCPSCQCGICGEGEYDEDGEQFVEKTILFCDQCDCGYHVGCLRARGHMGLESRPEGNWFCSRKCSEIFVYLQELLGKPHPTRVELLEKPHPTRLELLEKPQPMRVEGLSWTILRPRKNNGRDQITFDDETTIRRKLLDACSVLRECFHRMTHPLTKTDMIKDVVFNNEYDSHPNLNYRGFYTMILEKEWTGKPVSVATFRIRGEKVAEVSLLGTRQKFRRQKMCSLLLNHLQEIISDMGVKRMLLPAPPKLLDKWNSKFGFTPITDSERIELLRYPFIEFNDTIMCQKARD